MQRRELDVGIAERIRTNDFQRLGRLHQVVRGKGDRGELLPVAKDFRRDGLARVELKIHDEIGNCDPRTAVDEKYKVLVLDGDARL